MKRILGLFIFSLSLTSAQAQEVIAEWDDPAAGLAGWEKASTLTFTEYHETGGNPGGHIRTYGNMTTGIMNKQPEFTGNYVERNFNNISLDIMVNLQQLANFKPSVMVRYSPSFAGWLYELTSFDINTAGNWQHFDVYFDPDWTDAEAEANGWRLAPGPVKSFRETLEHVWAVSVTGPYPQITSKNLGYDNFKLSHVTPPPAEPEPETTTGEESQEQSTTTNETSVSPVRKLEPRLIKPPTRLPRKIE